MLLIFNNKTRKAVFDGNRSDDSKRDQPRTSVLKSACISYGDDNPREIECIVTDISEKGAKIFYVNPSEIPPVFRLTFKNSIKTYQCMVAWSSETEIGVKFFCLPLI